VSSFRTNGPNDSATRLPVEKLIDSCPKPETGLEPGFYPHKRGGRVYGTDCLFPSCARRRGAAGRPWTPLAVAGSYQKDRPPAADELWSQLRARGV
jgi:hypothetical protein